MFELAIVGAKNSGKTTLIEQLIPLLKKEKLRISTIKHTAHNHSFDIPGKDSHRHRTAGAELTIAISDTETALFSSSDIFKRNLFKQLINESCDICLIEGDKLSDLPKILLTENIENIAADNLDDIIASYGTSSFKSEISHIRLNNLTALKDLILNSFLKDTINEGRHA